MAMTPGLRKLALTAHITASIGWMGSIAAFLMLAISGLAAHTEPTIRAAYLMMELIARFIIVPFAAVSLLTGIIQSLGTSWGLFRHYWVLVKLLITALALAVLLAKLQLISHAARLATEPVLPLATLREAGLQLAVHAAGGFLVLLAPTLISVYKPWGLTPYGRRGRGAQPPATFRPSLPSYAPSMDSGVSVAQVSGTVTLTLRRAHLYGIAILVVVLHLIVLHSIGAMSLGH